MLFGDSPPGRAKENSPLIYRRAGREQPNPKRCGWFWGAHAPPRVPTGALAGRNRSARPSPNGGSFGHPRVAGWVPATAREGACAPRSNRMVPAKSCRGRKSIVVMSDVFFRPSGAFELSVPSPSDKSPGYFRVSLRDKAPPAFQRVERARGDVPCGLFVPSPDAARRPCQRHANGVEMRPIRVDS
jgi:hypothetical protein